jgi:hypothetical protein
MKCYFEAQQLHLSACRCHLSTAMSAERVTQEGVPLCAFSTHKVLHDANVYRLRLSLALLQGDLLAPCH